MSNLVLIPHHGRDRDHLHFGLGLKDTLARRAAHLLEAQIAAHLRPGAVVVGVAGRLAKQRLGHGGEDIVLLLLLSSSAWR